MDGISIPPELTTFLATFLTLAAIALVLALLLLAWIFFRIKRINLPPNADFFEALRHTPFVVVLFLDLLDFALDVFAIPIAWTVLTYLGLGPLRGISILEDAIPGTQAIPTMTLAWIGTRLRGKSKEKPELKA